jgi:hypothetical protein
MNLPRVSLVSASFLVPASARIYRHPNRPCWTKMSRLAFWALLALLSACATPAERLYGQALAWGLEPLELQGGGFRLASFYKRPSSRQHTLHVYLDGDGLPWASRSRVSPDPTPRHPLMLHLLSLDDSPALYLGRPCYHGHAGDPGCGPRLWTHRRYAPEIVASLTAALRQFLSMQAHGHLVFLGHSGGGALALLLAERFPETRAVVTLAGNLDIQLFAAHHGYSPLEGSLNPVRSSSVAFAEYHYFGARDDTIPPRLFVPIARMRPAASVTVIPGFDHRCCWESVWPEILARLPRR